MENVIQVSNQRYIVFPYLKHFLTRSFLHTSFSTDFNSIECGFDGLDCCPVLGDERLGDGICDGLIFNTDVSLCIYAN
jgi:hypothetical protein